MLWSRAWKHESATTYLPALVSLAQLITPRPQAASLVSMLAKFASHGSRDKFRARLAYVASCSRLNLILNCYAASPLTVHTT